ncbi:MAG: sialate O-acetylesterase [Planctomycetota bacterium]|jgi:sialate O-acetylesterase
MNKTVCICKPAIVVALVLLSGGPSVFGEVTLPAVICDHMVLQQEMKVPVWGWSAPGEQVEVKGSWAKGVFECKANKDGRWMVRLPAGKAGGPYEMVIKGENELLIKDILFGEVWVCSGQSNMHMSLEPFIPWHNGCLNFKQEIARADYPSIRLFYVQRRAAAEPMQDCEGKWYSCTPETIGGFSATAYFFGRELHKKLTVPVGLIHSSWGGTPAEAWMKRDAIESDPDFKYILDEYEQAVKKYTKAMKEYKQGLLEWVERVVELREKGYEPVGPPSWPPSGPGHRESASALYNGMISPLIPYGIRGAIWHQGEANAVRAYQYRKLFPAMIRCWRAEWDQGDFPFYFVQLCNLDVSCYAQQTPEAWAELREAQFMALSLPNTGMAVTIDIGDVNDIHPRNKQDAGNRLALWALAKTYGKELVCSGPLYKLMKVEGDKIVLHFDYIGGGMVSRDGKALKGFAIAGADREFVPADAKIVGGTVVVRADAVSKPVAVRYAWTDAPVCSLYNKEGLPASPFRTDDWRGVTVNEKTSKWFLENF